MVLRPRNMKLPSVQGKLMMDVWRGTPRVRAWPKKRSKAQRLEQQEREEWFRQAQGLTKYINSEQMVETMAATAGTPFLPRDLLTMAMAGRLWGIDTPGQGRMFSMAVVKDVSESLDAIGQVEGDMLFRDAGLWTRLPAGPAGSVLTSPGPGLAPVWGPGGGGGAQVITDYVGWDGEIARAATNAYHGNGFQCLEDVLLHSIGGNLFPVAGGVYSGFVASINAGGVIQTIEYANAISPGAGAERFVRLPFDVPAQLFAGTTYVIMLGRSDAGGSPGAAWREASSGNDAEFRMPGITPNNFYAIGVAVPLPGDVIASVVSSRRKSQQITYSVVA